MAFWSCEDRGIKNTAAVSCHWRLVRKVVHSLIGPDHAEALHVDVDAAEEPLGHLGEGVAHQPDGAQLQVVRHFLQKPASLFPHLQHRRPRLHGDLRRETGRRLRDASAAE